MCKCIEEYRELITSQYDAKSVSILGYGLIIPRDGRKAYNATHTDVEVNTEYQTKAGKIRYKKEIVSLLHTYCPFCGKKYNDTEDKPC